MAIATNLGFPRIGLRRELKLAVEGYWQGRVAKEELLATAAELRRRHWQLQRKAGIEHVPSNDFSLYDHVLDTAVTVGAIPGRFAPGNGPLDLTTYFTMARGTHDAAPLDMTKWFDTNYHYLVPEFTAGQTFRLASTAPIDAFCEALALGIRTRPVLLGPVSFLMLGKSKSRGFSPLRLMERLVPVYEQLLGRLAEAGAEWVQIDEPVLALDLPPEAQAALESAYGRLAAVRPANSTPQPLKPSTPHPLICLATYFGDLGRNLPLAMRLPVAAVHLDLVRRPGQLARAGTRSGRQVALAGTGRRPQHLAERPGAGRRTGRRSGPQGRTGSHPDRALLLAFARADRPGGRRRLGRRIAVLAGLCPAETG